MNANCWPIVVVLLLLSGSSAEGQPQLTRIPAVDVEAAQFPAADGSARNEDIEQLAAQLQAQASDLQELRDDLNATSADDSATEGLLSFRGKWDYGLWFESKNGEFRANIGGRVEHDWVWFDTEPELEAVLGRVEDGSFFRRARIHGAGTMYGVIDLFAEFEAAPVDNIVFQDMWAQLRGIPLLGHIRAGHVKVPFGLENYTSAKYVTFMERSAVHDAFQQEYDPGIMVWNYTPRKNATWNVAWMRLDAAESGRAFGNGRYSGVARVTAVPWATSDDHALLHLGGGFRYDNGGVFDPAVGTDVVRFRARPELRNTRRFIDSGPLTASGSSFLLLETAALVGSFSIQAEYVHTTVHSAFLPAGGPSLGNVLLDGYYVYTSYLFTGERRPYVRTNGTMGRVLPRNNVRPGTGRFLLLQGAWEMGVRYSYVDLNDTGVDGGKLRTITTGLTWYLNPNTKLLLNYIWARRDVPGPQVDGDANLFGMRFHVAF